MTTICSASWSASSRYCVVSSSVVPSPTSSRTSVVLPAPLGPSSANTVPGGTSRSTPASALVAPKLFTKPSTRTAAVGDVSACILGGDHTRRRTRRRALRRDLARRRLAAGRGGEAALQQHAAPARGSDGDVSDPWPLGRRVGGAQLRAVEDRAHDQAHLELGERSADAAPHTAAERNPGVALGGAFQEALGPESLRVRIEVLAEVDGGDGWHHHRARGYVVAGQLDAARQPARRVGDDRPYAQGILDRH